MSSEETSQQLERAIVLKVGRNDKLTTDEKSSVVDKALKIGMGHLELGGDKQMALIDPGSFIWQAAIDLGLGAKVRRSDIW